MRDVAQRFPDDDDVQVLFAESLMDLNPWKLWTLDGKPAPGTEEIVSRLETVLARDAGAPRREPLLHPRGRGLAAIPSARCPRRGGCRG